MTTTVRVLTLMKTERLLRYGSVISMRNFNAKDLKIYLNNGECIMIESR
jgi:hypothetical protein